MTLAGFLLGLIIASCAGLLYHLARGGSLKRLLLYLLSAWVGFFIGHGLGALVGWKLWRLGTLNLLPALLSALAMLVTADVLAGPRSRPRPKSSRPPRPDR